MDYKKCKGCEKIFFPYKKQTYCTTICCKEHHKRIRRVKVRKGRYCIENAERRVAADITQKLKQEIFDFMDEIKYKKCLFLDAVDSFRMIHYYVELFGVWYFRDLPIGDELLFCYRKCEEWMNEQKSAPHKKYVISKDDFLNQ